MKHLNNCVCFLLVFVVSIVCAKAGDVKISNYEISFDRNVGPYPAVLFTVSWENSWHNKKNHDAAWVFIKITDGRGNFWHANVAGNRAILIDNYEKKSSPAIRSTPDGMGVFIEPSTDYRGRISCRVKVLLDTAILHTPGLRIGQARVIVNAIEMVYIPTGSFYVGDPDSTASKFGAYYKTAINNRKDFLKLDSEVQQIEVGNTPGKLNYTVRDSMYQGDRSGPVPSTYPKGVRSFYLMKYELLQGQYAAFLNSVDSSTARIRDISIDSEYYKFRGTISKQAGYFVAGSPERPCNFTSWDDEMAYADWAGLRPYTDLEFTKAARGPGLPVMHDFPWGTNSKDKIARFVNKEGNLVYEKGVDESMLTEMNKDVLGASYYWVMDLAGSMWERVITIGDKVGRAFSGTHGNGMLVNGYADNADWPHGDKETGGYGYRGGGYYFDRLYSIFNPHSPVEYRQYGAWSGGKREIAYGTRFARTAD